MFRQLRDWVTRPRRQPARVAARLGLDELESRSLPAPIAIVGAAMIDDCVIADSIEVRTADAPIVIQGWADRIAAPPMVGRDR